jgi:4-oxalocrotonate tautomerase
LPNPTVRSGSTGSGGGLSSGRKELVPIVTVQMWEGRSEDQKRELVKAITDAVVEKAGTVPEAVHVVIYDISKSDWAIGGELCSDKY